MERWSSIGAVAVAASSPKRAKALASATRAPPAPSQSTCPSRKASASRARTGTGATEPSPSRTVRPSRSTTRAAITTLMTMALRVPTLRNSCGPRSTGSRTAVTSSPGSSTVFFTPVTNSSTGTRPGAGRSADLDDGVERGQHRQRVARPATRCRGCRRASRRCGSAASRPCGRPGTAPGPAPPARRAPSRCRSRRRRRPRSSPSRRQSRSSVTCASDTTDSGRCVPALTATIRSVPPARIVASGASCRAARVSSIDCGSDDRPVHPVDSQPLDPGPARVRSGQRRRAARAARSRRTAGRSTPTRVPSRTTASPPTSRWRTSRSGPSTSASIGSAMSARSSPGQTARSARAPGLQATDVVAAEAASAARRWRGAARPAA